MGSNWIKLDWVRYLCPGWFEIKIFSKWTLFWSGASVVHFARVSVSECLSDIFSNYTSSVTSLSLYCLHLSFSAIYQQPLLRWVTFCMVGYFYNLSTRTLVLCVSSPPCLVRFHVSRWQFTNLPFWTQISFILYMSMSVHSKDISSFLES